jgi:hypothetical protein
MDRWQPHAEREQRSSYRQHKQKTRHLPGFSLLTLEASIS